MMTPNKIDKDAVHTALAIATLSTICVGLINFGFDELKTWLNARREKDSKAAKSPSADVSPEQK